MQSNQNFSNNEDWKQCNLGDIVEFQRGFDLPKSKMIPGPYPVIGSNGIIGYHNEFTTDSPSITIGRSGNVGNPFIHLGKAWCHKTTLYSKKFNCDPLFSYYLLKTIPLYKYSGGSAVPTLNRNHIKNIPVKVPTNIENQKKISNFLYQFDRTIETNKKIIDNLDKQISLIFAKTFLYSKKKDIPLGKLVEKSISGDWGKDSPQNNYSKKVLCIRGADIHQIKSGLINKIPTRYILVKNFESKKLLPGNLIIEISSGSSTQSTGRSVLLEENFVSRLNGDIICTNFCKALKIKQNFNYFFYSYWNYLYSKGIFFNYENGTTGIKNLDLKSILTHITFPEPDPLDLKKFNTLCAEFMSMKDTLSHEISILSNMRDILNHRLISH